MADDVREFFKRIQLKPNIISGHVSSVQINKDSGEQEYATVVVGGNTLRVKVDAFAPMLANGDKIRLEQVGYAASAEYRLAGIEAGGRPASGSYQVLNDGTQIGGAVYAGGDFIMGQLSGGNMFAEYASGCLYHRIGTQVYGIEYPDGSQLYGHAVKTAGDWVPDGPNVFIEPAGVHIRNGAVDAITLPSSGNARIKGDIWADSLHIGREIGPALVGGLVKDFDAQGNVIPGVEHFGIRILDATGRPRISMITGTLLQPNKPAMFLGAPDDTHHLKFTDDEIEVKGRIIADSGKIGLFNLIDTRFESVNGRVLLIAESDETFGEGLVMYAGPNDDTGSVRWAQPDKPQTSLGLITTFYDATDSTWTMFQHVTTPQGDTTTPTKFVWRSGGWGQYGTDMTFKLGKLTVYELAPGSIFGGTFSGRSWSRISGAADIIFTTQMGVVARGGDSQIASGPCAQMLLNGAELMIDLRKGDSHMGLDAQRIKTLVLRWEKKIQAAYLSEVKVVGWRYTDDTRTTFLTLSNVQAGQPAGKYYTTVVTTGSEINVGDYSVVYLIVKASGIASNGDIVIYSAFVKYDDTIM